MKKKTAVQVLVVSILALLVMTGSMVQAAVRPSLAQKNAKIVIGEAKDVKVKNAPKGAKIVYKPENRSVVSVSKRGKATGQKAGNTRVSVVVKKGERRQKLTYKITVKKPKLSRSSITIEKGKTYSVTIKDRPKKSSKAKYTWTSTDNKVAKVKNGKISGVSAGSATVKVKVAVGRKISYTLKTKVTVESKEILPTKISLDKTKIVIKKGDAEKIMAAVFPENAADKTIIWSSSDESVAVVQDGLVTGKSEGVALVTAATCNGKSSVCSVEVARGDEDIEENALGDLASDITGAMADVEETAIFTLALKEGSLVGSDPIVLTRDSRFIGVMHDDGEDGDAVAGDGICSLKISCRNEKDMEEEYKAICGKDFSNVVRLRYFGEISEKDLVKHSAYIERLQDIESSVISVDGETDTERLVEAIYQETLKEEKKGSILSVSKEEGGVSIQFSSGIWYIYQPEQKSVDAAGDAAEVSIMTLQPYKGTYDAEDDRISTEATDGSAKKIEQSFSDHRFDQDHDDGEVTLDVIKNMSSDQLMLCHTHGFCNDELGPMIWLGEKVRETDLGAGGKYERDFLTGRIVISKDTPGYYRIGFTSGYVQKYLRDLDNSFIYLGACLSGKDPRLAQSFLEKGAAVVVANSDTIWRGYICAMMKDIVNGLLIKDNGGDGYNTLEKALEYAKKNNGENDYQYYPSNDHAPSVPLIFGDKNYRLSDPAGILPDQITLDKQAVEIDTGKSIKLSAVIQPENAANKSVMWKSSLPAVVQVDSKGEVTAKAPGEAEITASTVNGRLAVCHVKVRAAVIGAESITLDKIDEKMEVGKSITIHAVIQPDDTTDKNIEWKSSAFAVAQVDSKGEVTARAPGEAEITASTVNGKTAVCRVTVESPVVEAESISIENMGYPVYIGNPFYLTAMVRPENTTDQTVTWEISDGSVAKIEAADPQDGRTKRVKVTPLQDGGKATITATTLNGKRASFKFVSLCPPLPVVHPSDRPILGPDFVPTEEITLDKEEVKMQIRDSITITAVITPENAAHRSAEWESSDPDVAEVDDKGVITAKAPGEAVITATTIDDKKAHCQVTVEPVVRGVEGLTLVSKGYPTDVMGAFYLIVIAPNDTEKEIVKWEVSDSDIVKIEPADPQDGRYQQVKVTLMYVGKASITAKTENGKKAVFEVDSKFPSRLTPPTQTEIPHDPGGGGDSDE